jgi:hypothetical protein
LGLRDPGSNPGSPIYFFNKLSIKATWWLQDSKNPQVVFNPGSPIYFFNKLSIKATWWLQDSKNPQVVFNPGSPI